MHLYVIYFLYPIVLYCIVLYCIALHYIMVYNNIKLYNSIYSKKQSKKNEFISIIRKIY
jgi:hypothetical protein